MQWYVTLTRQHSGQDLLRLSDQYCPRQAYLTDQCHGKSDHNGLTISQVPCHSFHIYEKKRCNLNSTSSVWSHGSVLTGAGDGDDTTILARMMMRPPGQVSPNQTAERAWAYQHNRVSGQVKSLHKPSNPVLTTPRTLKILPAIFDYVGFGMRSGCLGEADRPNGPKGPQAD
ncbi:hypothetical protein ElyMa_000834400 [Elysia marginata]|uniref:Uncharacterized protein n=1 Tax=Elysia marginata TaxID=1093978 RepID=A0AAV4H003_9GAST|nr:hypothetical protein ElyMa_000834400 [Elysia marginata]